MVFLHTPPATPSRRVARKAAHVSKQAAVGSRWTAQQASDWHSEAYIIDEVNMTLLAFFFIGLFASAFSTVAGFGGGIVLMALGAFLQDVKSLIPISTAFFWTLSLAQVLTFRKHTDQKSVSIYCLAAIPGVFAAAAAYYLLPSSAIKLCLAAVVGIYCLMSLLKWVPQKTPSTAATAAISFLTGAVDIITASGGVLQAPLFLARGLRKEAFVASFAMTSVIVNPVKVAIYAAMGFFAISDFTLVAVLSVAGFLGVQLGRIGLARISAETFKTTALIFLILVAIRMIFL